jgi:hypothetical protein
VWLHGSGRRFVRDIGASEMNRHHRKTLHAIFAHPVSANISFKDVMHVFESLGAEIDQKSGRRVGVKLNGHSVASSHAQHSLPTDEVAQVRQFLETCGIGPDQFPM